MPLRARMPSTLTLESKKKFYVNILWLRCIILLCKFALLEEFLGVNS